MNDGPPPLRTIIEDYGLAAKRSLGQHFLLDLNITDKIVRYGNVSSGDHVLEVGPGPGGLTRSLLNAGAEVIAIERDTRCIEALNGLAAFFPEKLSIIEADALTAKEADLIANKAPIRILSNLPYNISTELLIKWLRAGPVLWRSMTLMFQKEVADRILAKPGSKTYGRLSVIAQAASRPERAFDLPARAFTPPPKVASSIVHFLPPSEAYRNFRALEAVTAAAFGQRRKMLRTSLKPIFGENVLEACDALNVAPDARAEAIDVETFKAIAEHWRKSEAGDRAL